MKFETMIILGMLLFIVVNVAIAREKEKVYQQAWCSAQGGKSEVVMPDRSRADCLLQNYAIEFDFCTKWAECIGQSLSYATMTNKKPMCILICNPKNQQRYIDRYNNALKYINRYEKPKLIVILE